MPRSGRPHLLARNPLILAVSTAMLLAGALPVAAAPGISHNNTRSNRGTVAGPDTDLGGELLEPAAAINHETTRSNRGTVAGPDGDGDADSDTEAPAAAINHNNTRSNRGNVADTGSGALESAASYSTSRSNGPSFVDTEDSGSRSTRPTVTCNDGAIVACFEGSVQVQCGDDAGVLRPEVAGVDGGACATHGGVREVSVQPYDFICAMPESEVYAKDGSDMFLKACEVREMCLDGKDGCEEAQTLSLVTAFPDITVAQLSEDNVGLAVVAELDRMLRYLSNLDVQEGAVDLTFTGSVPEVYALLSAASTDELNTALTLVCAGEAELAHEAAHIVQQANGLTRSDGGGGGCTPTLSDLIKDWPFAAANGGTAGDQQLMVADFRDAATLELSDADLSIAKISANVADAFISYWGASDQLGSFPEAELRGTAVGAAKASNLERTSMLLHAVRGGVQAGMNACLDNGENDVRLFKSRCGR